MGKLGILELIIILMALIAFIVVVVLSVSKLIKCKIDSNQKIIWVFVMIFFHVLGIIIFLIYHDYFLSPELRANL